MQLTGFASSIQNNKKGHSWMERHAIPSQSGEARRSVVVELALSIWWSGKMPWTFFRTVASSSPTATQL